MSDEKEWDLKKIPQKYNRKAKLHGAVKSINGLDGWKKIILEMRTGQTSPTDPYIEKILHNCTEVLKEARNHEVRKLSGLAKDLLLFSDLCEILILDEGWNIKLSGSLELT